MYVLDMAKRILLPSVLTMSYHINTIKNLVIQPDGLRYTVQAQLHIIRMVTVV